MVKRYVVREAGAARVLALCDSAAGNLLAIAGITQPEVAAAMRRKLRRREIGEHEFGHLWQEFVSHRDAGAYQLVPLDQPTFLMAEQIAIRHLLRGYDAVQIACALHARPILATADPDFLFVTGDRAQAAIAELEGLPVELVA